MMMRLTGLMLLLLLFLPLACADYDLLDDEKNTIDTVALSIDETTDSSVTLRWTRYTDDDFAHYVVLYGTNDIVDWSDKVSDSLVFDFDTVKIVQPLDDMTHYYFRVMVLSDNGVFSGSNTVDTVTPENMHGKLRLGNPEIIDDENARLIWTGSIDESDRYVVYADTTRAVDTIDTLLRTVYSDTSVIIDGTLFGRSFWVRVYSFLDTSVTAKSNVVEVRKE